MPHRNRHGRRRWWWRRRRYDRRRLNHDRRRLNHDRCGRHNRRRRHHRGAVVRIPVGVIPDLPIPATPVMWMRCRSSPPTAQTRRWHTTMKYVARRRRAMRPMMTHTVVVFRMHRTGTGPHVVRGMAGRNSPSGTGNEATRNGKNDRPFHTGIPFCFRLRSTSALRRCAQRVA